MQAGLRLGFVELFRCFDLLRTRSNVLPDGRVSY